MLRRGHDLAGDQGAQGHIGNRSPGPFVRKQPQRINSASVDCTSGRFTTARSLALAAVVGFVAVWAADPRLSTWWSVPTLPRNHVSNASTAPTPAPDSITLAPIEAASPSSDPLIVFATERGRNANEGRALIGSTPREAITYAAGALLPDGARVIGIGSDHAVLEHSGTHYQVPTGSSVPAIAPIALGTSMELDSSVAPERARAAMSHDPVSKVLRLVALYDGSQMMGYALYPGSDATLFERIGLQPGDVLIGVDGDSLADPHRTGQRLQALGSGSAQSLTVRRAGEPMVVVVRTDLVNESDSAADSPQLVEESEERKSR